jgi:signal recognition particle receptor subunit beta
MTSHAALFDFSHPVTPVGRLTSEAHRLFATPKVAMMPGFRVTVVAPAAESKTRQDLLNRLAAAFAWLGPQWSVAEPGSANLLLIILNSAECSRNLWEEQRRVFPAERILVYGAGPLPADARWSLPRMHRGAPTVLSLVNALLRMEESLKGISTPADIYQPENHIQGIIADALADGMNRICSRPEEPEAGLYILPRENTAYILGDIERTIPLCISRREALKVATLSDEELQREAGYLRLSSRLSKHAAGLEEGLKRLNPAPARRYSLRELIWFATLVNSKGRLRAGCSLDDEIIVKHWPEFTRLQYYQDYLEIAKLMSRRTLRVREVAAQTGLSLRQVIDFDNACAALGMVERGERAHREVQQHELARNRLHELLKPFAEAHGSRLKLVVAGTVGSGKTTALVTLSDFLPAMTETRPSDGVFHQKSSTTVAMDYGEARFDDLKLLLFGTPGQKRFDFMGEILSRNAWALLILIDNTQDNPLAELDYYFNLYQTVIPHLRVLIGITHADGPGGPSLVEYRNYLASRGVDYPVAQLDPRDYLGMVKFLGDTVAQAGASRGPRALP